MRAKLLELHSPDVDDVKAWRPEAAAFAILVELMVGPAIEPTWDVGVRGLQARRYGNLTQSANAATALTTYSYETASHLKSIDNTGTTQDATFTFDALGRYRERTVNGVTDQYGCVGLSEATSTIVGATTRASAISADGTRVATKDGSTSAFLIPDLHGIVAAMEQAGAVTIANAIRYDAYGQTMGSPYTGTGSVKLDTKYQGRLDVSPNADPLYDMSARCYAPSTAI